MRRNVNYKRASPWPIVWVHLLSVSAPASPPMKGWQKGNHCREGLKGTRKTEPVFGAKAPLPGQSRGKGFTVCHVEFWSISGSQQSDGQAGTFGYWELWRWNTFASHFHFQLSESLVIFTRVYSVDVLVVGNVDQIRCRRGWGGGGKEDVRLEVFSIDRTHVGSKCNAIHLLWPFVDHVCWEDKWTPWKDIYLNYPHKVPSLCKKKNGKEGRSVHRCLTLELIEEKDKDSWCNQCLYTYMYVNYICLDGWM